MNVEQALVILDTALRQNFLNNVEELVFRQAWDDQTYAEMAATSGYDANYLKDVGSKLWKLLSKALGETVTKSNFRSVLRRQLQHPQLVAILLAPSTGTEESYANSQNTKTDLLSGLQNRIMICPTCKSTLHQQ